MSDELDPVGFATTLPGSEWSWKKRAEKAEAERDRLLERVEGLSRQVIRADAENERLREALEWYEEWVRKHYSPNYDEYTESCRNLAEDGGKRARDALVGGQERGES